MAPPALLKLQIDSKHTWLVGDIHGQYDLLMVALQQQGFSAVKGDILVSVGDLIDRGPDSLKTLKLLEHDWFYAVMGNHEQLLLKGVAAMKGNGNIADILNWQTYNGGHWYSQHSHDSKVVATLLKAISELPLAIELLCEAGSIGVIHAAVPNNDWLDEAALAQEFGTKHALWHRENGLAARYLQNAVDIDQTEDPFRHQVTGVDKVVVGHTIMTEGKPVYIGNTLYLDVGAANGVQPAVIRADKVLQLNNPGSVTL